MKATKVPKTDDLIALICKAATEKYREDKVRPGIQIAHIPGEARFYVALHRYPNQTRECQNPIVAARMRENPFRKVVFTAEHEDLDRAVQLLALQMLPVEAQAELAAAIRGLK